MEWQKGQWIRCDFTALKTVNGAFPKNENGQYTGELEKTHCFYLIRGIQKAKGTFTIFYPNYVFSLDDGSVMWGKEKNPHYARASHLSKEDEEYVNKALAESPTAWMIGMKK